MTVTLRRCADASEVLGGAAAVLAAREGDHTALYAQLGRLRSEPDDSAYLAVLRDGDDVVACAAGTPASRISVSHIAGASRSSAIAAITDDLARAVPDLSALMAPVAIADAIAVDVGRRTGRQVYVAMAQRHFEADAVAAVPDVPGKLRRAGENDRSLLEEWIGAFIVEALHDDPARAPSSAERWLHNADDDGHLVVWEDAGEPVCMAGFLGPTPNGITLLSVYTPPNLRGRGYASACTAALTQYLLDNGRRRVFLSTDLANPTSNRIYQRLGYRPLGDSTLYRFD